MLIESPSIKKATNTFKSCIMQRSPARVISMVLVETPVEELPDNFHVT